MFPKHFHSCEKTFRQRNVHNFNRKFVIVVPLAKQNSTVFRDGPYKIVGNVRLVHKQSIRFAVLVLVDVHFNIEKNRVENIVYKNNEGNWSLLLLLHPFLIRFCLCFLLLFNVFGILSFVTTTLGFFQFQSQVLLSENNLVLSIGLIIKLYAAFLD